ncbi:MAG: VOC family protein [Planctomycetota bacterium]
MSPPPSQTMIAIDHVQLTMPQGEEDKARAFFAGVLGMEEVPKPKLMADRGGCWFVSGPVHIHVGVEDDFTPQRKAHPALIVPDLDAMADTLADAGHRVDWDTLTPERRRFHTDDPFGNRIEFLGEGDGFTQKPW